MELNIAGAFLCLCGITNHSQSIHREYLHCVLTAVSGRSDSRIRIWLKPLIKSSEEKIMLSYMVSSTISLRRTDVRAGMDASFSLLKARTTRHLPVAFFMQNVQLECADVLTRTRPALHWPLKNVSIASTRSRSRVLCCVKQYLNPGHEIDLVRDVSIGRRNRRYFIWKHISELSRER